MSQVNKFAAFSPIFGKMLIDALGLPKNTTHFRLDVSGSDFPVVTIEYMPREEELASMVSVIEQFKLVKAEE